MIRKTLWVAVAALLLFGPMQAGLAAGPGVHGRVLGHDEQGSYLGIVAGAKIQFETTGGSPAGQCASDANGYYKIDLAPGEYLYKIKADGYRSEDRGRGMRLTQSQGYAVFNLALTKGQDDPNRQPPEPPKKKLGRLHGRVLEETKTARVGIPDARIMLRREGTNELVTVVSRGSADGQRQAGDYRVTLEAGVYRASVMAAGFETLVDPNSIEIKADEDTERDFVLRRREPTPPADQGIRGVVTVVDSNAKLPAVKLQIAPLTGASLAPIEVPLAANGSFSQRLPVGRYRVTATAEGFPSATSPPAFVFAGRYTLVNLALRHDRVPEPKTTVDVFVYERRKEGESLVGLSGARVALLKKGADAATAQEATTSSNGHAIFAVTEPGEYAAQAFLKGYRPGEGQGVVAPGQSHEVGIELTKEERTPPTEATTLEITAIDAATKRPLNGVRVLARRADQSLAEAARGATNSAGQATLSLPSGAGEYTVLGQLSGYEPAGVKVNVAASQASRAILALRPIAPPVDEPRPPLPPDDRPPPVDPERATAIVRGFVAYREVSGALRAVPDAKVIWERVTPARPSVTQFVATQRQGRFSLELPRGVYQVRIDPPAGFEDLLERVVVEPGMAERYFILRRAERPEPKPGDDIVAVQGTVVAAALGGVAPVRDAELLFVRAGGSERAQSGTKGEFQLRLPADVYRVHVRAKGYRPLDAQSEVRPGMSPLRYTLQREEESAKESRLQLQLIERGRHTTSGIRAVADAKVQVFVGNRLVEQGESNRAGQFSARLRPGSYTVRATKTGFQPATLAVEIADRDVNEQMTLVREAAPEPEPDRKGALMVRVTQPATRPSKTIKASGLPLPGAQVSIFRGSSRVAGGTTDGSGVFRAPLEAGRYSVKVEHEGFAPAGRTVSVAGQENSVEVLLERLQSDDRPTVTPQPDVRPKPPGLDFGGGRPKPTGGKTEVFVAEYRASPQGAWVPIVKRSSRTEAQRALVQAIARGMIPKTAETRVREE